ncbi:MAG: hypothetical protein JXB04_10220 [Kiritimatiellae bacterium]|nr:hypothetical protein [Kiritimatiellia bacterium]
MHRARTDNNQRSDITAIWAILLLTIAALWVGRIVKLAGMLTQPGTPPEWIPIINRLLPQRGFEMLLYLAGGVGIILRRRLGWWLGLLAWGYLLATCGVYVFHAISDRTPLDIATLAYGLLAVLALGWLIARRSEFPAAGKSSQPAS